MRHFEVRYVEQAIKDLEKLERKVAQRIYKKIDSYVSSPDPLAHAKSLSGKLKGLYRFRVGDYRVIFEVAEDGSISILTILVVAHRKDIYKK
jgi:mRNA interferase RelE/StbE